MRILFVASLLSVRNFQPLGLEYLSAGLKKAGHEVLLADATHFQPLEKAIRQFKPAVVGYYSSTGVHRSLIEANRNLKSRYDFFSVFGGPHPTFFPEMIEKKGVDAICRGEGEEAIVELADALESKKDYLSISNFWFKHENEIVKNPVRPLIKNLDLLPFPDWSLSDSISFCRDFPVKIFMASRGCPYECTFCYNPTYRKLYEGQPIYRRFSPEKIVTQIEQCKSERPVQFVYLFDDTFGLGKSWLQDFCKLYKERIGLPFYSHFRADVITPEGAKAMAEAGLAYSAIGLESGSETIRNGLLNKQVTDDQIAGAASALHKNRVPFATFNLLGVPGTSLEDDLQTLRLNWKLRPTYAEALMFMPYPRTVLGAKAMEMGLFSGDPDEIPNSFKRTSPVKQDQIKERTRLMYLFPILVRNQVSDKILRLLLRLPLSQVYRVLSRIYEGLVKVRKIYRVSIPKEALVKMVWNYLKY